MAARESSHESAAPKEQPPPESLRHQGPRAPDSLERAPASGPGPPKGQSSQALGTDGGGSQALGHPEPAVAPFAGAQLMSREVHNGPTDETQARGTPYSGDPQGGVQALPPELDKLPLDAWHRDRGARMVPFAGYEMPVQYEGIMAEHLWTRENAGLFDVSHMGQLLVHGQNVDAALETLIDRKSV